MLEFNIDQCIINILYMKKACKPFLIGGSWILSQVVDNTINRCSPGLENKTKTKKDVYVRAETLHNYEYLTHYDSSRKSEFSHRFCFMYYGPILHDPFIATDIGA